MPVAVDHDAGANTPAHRHHHKVVHSVAVAEPLLGDSQGVHVVLQAHWQPEVDRHRFRNRHISPAEERGVAADAGLAVYHPGHADANPQHPGAVYPSLSDGALDRTGNRLKDIVRVRHSGGAQRSHAVVEDAGIQVGQGAGDSLFHELKANHEAGLVVEA